MSGPLRVGFSPPGPVWPLRGRFGCPPRCDSGPSPPGSVMCSTPLPYRGGPHDHLASAAVCHVRADGAARCRRRGRVRRRRPRPARRVGLGEAAEVRRLVRDLRFHARRTDPDADPQAARGTYSHFSLAGDPINEIGQQIFRAGLLLATAGMAVAFWLGGSGERRTVEDAYGRPVTLSGAHGVGTPDGSGIPITNWTGRGHPAGRSRAGTELTLHRRGPTRAVSRSGVSAPVPGPGPPVPGGG